MKTVAVLTLSLLAVTSFGQGYKFYDIGTELGSNFGDSESFGVNDLGQVVGYARRISDNRPQAFLWDKTNGVTFLGDLPGGTDSSIATSINEHGQVVGNSNGSNGTEMFIWDAINGMQGLGRLGGTTSSAGLSINNAGTVVGRSGDFGVQWDSVNGLQLLDQSAALGNAINEIGIVAGVGYPNSDRVFGNAMIWSSGAGIQYLGGFSSGADFRSSSTGINDLGQVVGFVSVDGFSDSFIWDSIGGIRSLGDLLPNSRDTKPYSINNNGQVTGFSASLNSAFLWDEVNGMRNLADLTVGIPTDYLLGQGVAINNHGSIAGFGGGDRPFRGAFYAEAVPEPGTMAVLAGIGMIAVRRRNRS